MEKTGMTVNDTDLNDQSYWYKDAIIYELHIKAFKDGNGDGIGDFQGLLEKLDYLQELGITAIWVLPFYPSPLKDDGYDIADYYSINTSYGDIEQFKELLDEAHKRNLKVITELVLNHTSDQHPWFQRSRTAAKNSPERNYYVWTDNPHQYKDVRIIFQDFETSNWTWDPVAQQYYWHRFFHHQPDLNYDNPLVQEEVFKIIDYWCLMGVDAFRLDAVPYLYEREGTNGENLKETHDFLKRLRKHVDEKFPGTVFLAEANMWPEDSASYFGNGDECHMNYHFPVMPRMFMAVQREDRYPITDIFDQTPEIPQNCQWAMFLRNHDELTLEMVTDEERDYMYKAYAKDPKARINLGIRQRLAPLMENNRRKIELMNSLLFSMPGTPVIYYGDEIGMGDNFYLGDRDGVRTPMQWSPDRNAGFSTANPHRLYLPVILDPEYNYEAVNVETQRKNTSSLFWFMKRLINIRKKYKAFGRGAMKFLNVENPKILAFTRTYNEETLLIIVNLSKYSQATEINLSEFKGHIPVEVFSKNKFPLIKENNPYFFTLGPHSFQWFELRKSLAESQVNSELPVIKCNSEEEFLNNGIKEELENSVLPAYFLKNKWFKGKNRPIYSCYISDLTKINLDSYTVYLVIVEVNYQTGLPESYQVALTIGKEHEAVQLSLTFPEAVLAKVKISEQEFILCDAFYIKELRDFLINGIAGNLKRNTIQFEGKESVRNFLKDHGAVISKMHHSDENNTSINYDNTFYLKIYRKVESGIHPDIEITRFLTEKTIFSHVPPYLGSFSWKDSKNSTALGIMQPMIENHGDGRIFMIERLNNYIERILAHNRYNIDPDERIGKFTDPVSYDQLPQELQTLLGPTAAEFCKLLGLRTAQMHLSLASSNDNPDFKPEEFSLHYQRSLFSSMVSLVRETYQNLEKYKDKIQGYGSLELNHLLKSRNLIVDTLKKIYSKKLDIFKTRIHGNYNLRKILLTGKDLCIHDFGGDPFRTHGERRLKRSPIRDIAFMIRSFYYVAFESFHFNNQISKLEYENLLPFAWLWSYHMSGFFIKEYLETAKGSRLIPNEQNDLNMVLQIFLLERAMYALNYELNNRLDHAIVPLRLASYIINTDQQIVNS